MSRAQTAVSFKCRAHLRTLMVKVNRRNVTDDLNREGWWSVHSGSQETGRREGGRQSLGGAGSKPGPGHLGDE